MNNYDKEISRLILGNNHVIITDLRGNTIYSSDEIKFGKGVETKRIGDLVYFAKNGRYYQVQKKSEELDGEKVEVCSFQDITDLLIKFKEMKGIAEERKEKMSKDPLTGVFTKQGFKDKLAKHYKEDFCLAMLDIDNFKQINDSYGHTVADEALAVIGPFLTDQFRETDIIGRFGGDEFVIACQSSDGEKIARKLEEVRENILKLTNNKINITVGITEYDSDLAYDDNMRRADIALYHGKQEGKGKVVVYSQEIEKSTDLKNTKNREQDEDR